MDYILEDNYLLINIKIVNFHLSWLSYEIHIYIMQNV